MLVIMIKTLTFTKDLPACEGEYLIKWKYKGHEVIHIYFRPKVFSYGVEWDEGFFISTWNNKHVSHINLDILEGIAKL